MDLEIKITGSDGRGYNNAADMFEAEGKRRIDGHVTNIEGAVRSQRCSVHGKHASANVRRSGGKITFDISACCDDLRERAQEAANAARS